MSLIYRRNKSGRDTILNNHQYGFRKKPSSSMAILEITNERVMNTQLEFLLT